MVEARRASCSWCSACSVFACDADIASVFEDEAEGFGEEERDAEGEEEADDAATAFLNCRWARGRVCFSQCWLASSNSIGLLTLISLFFDDISIER